MRSSGILLQYHLHIWRGSRGKTVSFCFEYESDGEFRHGRDHAGAAAAEKSSERDFLRAVGAGGLPARVPFLV